MEDNYGSIADPARRDSKSLLDIPANADLGNIQEHEALHDPLTTINDDEHFFDSESDEELDAGLSRLSSDISSQGFHLGDSTRVSASNILVHERRTASFMQHGDEYERVNTQLKNNIRLVEDPNLIDDARGRLYLARYSFYKNSHDLKFAMTVQSNIYEKIFAEVNDSNTIPCNLYFCCHGGDGAHTGVSHRDSVNIRLAWFFFSMVILGLMAVEFLVDGE